MAQTAQAGAENRRQRRYPAALDVTVRDLPLSTRNVSRSGLQLVCPSMSVRLISDDLETKPLTLCVLIPGGDTIEVNAQAMYVSPHDDEYLIGVKLVSFVESGQARFERYLETLLARFG